MPTITRDIHDSLSFQVVIVGGGPAGWIAAVAAARQGVRTALIERLGFLGGTATACLVVPVSGFFKNGERVVNGLPWEFIREMQALNAAQLEMPKGHISVDPEIYKLVAQRMVRQAGVQLFANAVLTDVVRDGRFIRTLVVESQGQTLAIDADCVVDATGNATVFAKAGLPTALPAVPQPISLCFELCGVDTTTPLLQHYIHHDGRFVQNSCQMDIHNWLAKLREQDCAPDFGGPWFNTLLHNGHLAVNITRHAAPAPGRSDDATQAELQLREDMFTLVGLLKSHYPEFKHCAIVASGVQAGLRDGRRIVGLHTLTAAELLAATPFDDAIARNAHPMDIHIAGTAAQTLRAVPQAGYIPYRSLVSPDCDNLLAAGRAIDADDHAHASIRVQGTVMAIGEAAGTAAALAIRHHQPVSQIDIAALRRLLQPDTTHKTTAP